MAELQLRSLIRQLRRTIVLQEKAGYPPDAQLLEAFVQQRDDLAFEILVWRHGLMVLDLCRQILQDEYEAEDAFQATFLIFVRYAGSIGKRQSVGSWLYKVAYRVAHRLRAKLARRRPEQLAAVEDIPASESTDNVIWRDLRPVLDEEIARLPEKFRSPIVLCYLQGHTTEEAAELLQCPKGTLLFRLSEARELLRLRLSRRGLAISTSWLAEQLCVNASSATVPTALVDTTVKAAIEFAAGQSATGVVSRSVAALTQGVLRTMYIAKLTKIAAIVITVAAFCLVTGSVTPWSLANSYPLREVAADSAVRVQDKDQPKKAISFYATIKKIDGNKITVNRSTKDTTVDDAILTASKNVKVVEKKAAGEAQSVKAALKILQAELAKSLTPELIDRLLNDANLFEEAPVDGGLKSSIFANDVRARITTDAKNNITEICVHPLQYPK